MRHEAITRLKKKNYPDENDGAGGSDYYYSGQLWEWIETVAKWYSRLVKPSATPHHSSQPNKAV